ncbi:hypothetical protein ACTAQJ_08005 [Arthrobacter sp. alpha11c]
MSNSTNTMPDVRRMTMNQAIKLAAFVAEIRPEWSAGPIRGLLQAHTYGSGGVTVMGVEELTRRTVAAAFTSPQTQLTELPAERGVISRQ